jgi:hypothetical protein
MHQVQVMWRIRPAASTWTDEAGHQLVPVRVSSKNRLRILLVMKGL